MSIFNGIYDFLMGGKTSRTPGGIRVINWRRLSRHNMQTVLDREFLRVVRYLRLRHGRRWEFSPSTITVIVVKPEGSNKLRQYFRSTRLGIWVHGVHTRWNDRRCQTKVTPDLNAYTHELVHHCMPEWSEGVVTEQAEIIERGRMMES